LTSRFYQLHSTVAPRSGPAPACYDPPREAGAMPLYVRTILITGPADDAEPVCRLHREHLMQLSREGRLRAAGQFNAGDGFLEIFEAEDLKDAQRIGESSPLISDGLATWMIREWTELTL
jgi:uncharacterized protein YciI